MKTSIIIAAIILLFAVSGFGGFEETPQERCEYWNKMIRFGYGLEWAVCDETMEFWACLFGKLNGFDYTLRTIPNYGYGDNKTAIGLRVENAKRKCVSVLEGKRAPDGYTRKDRSNIGQWWYCKGDDPIEPAPKNCWEYYTGRTHWYDMNTANWLKARGLNGWEFVTSHHWAGEMIEWVFKRPISCKEP